MGSVQVVAREEELAALAEFLAAPAPAALILEGVAGAGKTTLWEAAVARAGEQRMIVLQARAAQSEAKFSFVVVADLMDAVADDVLPRLDDPLARALQVALLRTEPEEGGEVSARAVGAALAAAVRVLGEDRPVLVAVDDVHWVDPASAAALGFMLRRLDGAPAHVLLAERPGESSSALGLARPPVEDRLRRLAVGPFSLGALQRLLLARLGASPSRPVLRRLHEASGGNPFHALELARVEATGTLPEATRTLVRARLDAFPRATRQALTHVALLSSPDLETLRSSLGEDPAELLAAAVSDGLVAIRAERITFSHPLYASALLADVGDAELHDVHARLATVAPTEEERARHLALATATPDAQVALRLEKAARTAAARGAVAAGAKLFDEAARLTPPGDAEARARRQTLSGMTTFVAGDSERAMALLEECVASAPTAALRAEALEKLARVCHLSHDLPRAIVDYQAGIDIGAQDPVTMAQLHEGLAWCLLLQRRDMTRAGSAAEAGVAFARAAGDDVTLADALSALFHVELLRGRGYPEAIVREALEVRPVDNAAYGTRILRDPRVHRAYTLIVVDRLDEAVETYEEVVLRAYASGDESGVPFVLMRLAQALLLQGELDAAGSRAQEALQVAVDARQWPRVASMKGLMALMAVTRGRLDEARELAADGLARVEQTDDGIARRMAAWALGQAELLAGRPQAALGHLEPLRASDIAAGIADPGENRHLADLIEAFAAAGRVAEAEALAIELTGLGQRLGRPSAEAAGLRGQAIAATARGEHESALQLAERALSLPVTLPLEVLRTRIAAGVALRHLRRRKESRAMLQAARDGLVARGAWGPAARAESELARIGGRAPADGTLTPAEEAVARLVAEGRTNRETAAALYVSDRTVETHLSRIYAKLAVRSRAELAAHFRDAG